MKSEAARFIQWNDGFIAAKEGKQLKSNDPDFVAGYRYYQHMEQSNENRINGQ